MPKLRPKQINSESANTGDALVWDGTAFVPQQLSNVGTLANVAYVDANTTATTHTGSLAKPFLTPQDAINGGFTNLLIAPADYSGGTLTIPEVDNSYSIVGLTTQPFPAKDFGPSTINLGDISYACLGLTLQNISAGAITDARSDNSQTDLAIIDCLISASITGTGLTNVRTGSLTQTATTVIDSVLPVQISGALQNCNIVRLAYTDTSGLGTDITCQTFSAVHSNCQGITYSLDSEIHNSFISGNLTYSTGIPAVLTVRGSIVQGTVSLDQLLAYDSKFSQQVTGTVTDRGIMQFYNCILDGGAVQSTMDVATERTMLIGGSGLPDGDSIWTIDDPAGDAVIFQATASFTVSGPTRIVVVPSTPSSQNLTLSPAGADASQSFYVDMWGSNAVALKDGNGGTITTMPAQAAGQGLRYHLILGDTSQFGLASFWKLTGA